MHGVSRSQHAGSEVEADAEVRELAHDVLQGVMTIHALLAGARHGAELSPNLQQCLAAIEEEARYLTDVCRGAVGGSLVRDVRVEDVAAEVVRSARACWTGRMELAAEPAVVHIDETDLRRALSNLVNNACRAAGGGGRVEVRVLTDGDVVRIEVHDSGPGFGLGPAGLASMGLHIVQRVADSYGGCIEIHDSPLGGAFVGLVLPRAGGWPRPRGTGSRARRTSRR